MSDSNERPRCVRPIELAEMAGVQPQMIHNYISAGRIPAIRCTQHGGTRCIDIDDAKEWLDKREAKEAEKKKRIKRQLRGEV